MEITARDPMTEYLTAANVNDSECPIEIFGATSSDTHTTSARYQNYIDIISNYTDISSLSEDDNQIIRPSISSAENESIILLSSSDDDEAIDMPRPPRPSTRNAYAR